MGQLIIANTPFEIDAPIINFLQPPYWNATVEACVPTISEPHPACPGGITPYGEKAMNRSPRRYAFRPALRRYDKNPPLDAVKAVLRQFVLHHDGCATAEMCWNVLHNERGLSCHFLIDNDGTIYQTIDLAYMAYHAAAWNVNSIGVEFCNRGDAKKEPDYYSRHHQQRDTKVCKINNYTYLAFDFTPAQYYSFEKLARALTKLLPNMPVEYPQTSPGEQAWDTLPDAFGYSGYLGHYHCTAAKWDPGPFDFKAMCRKLRGAYCFPLFASDTQKNGAHHDNQDKPEIPARVDELKEMANALYKANEQHADGGFFPVGPWGESRLWHGGVHLAAKENAPVFAPFPGRIVAARMGGKSAIGSTNFVLLRHDLSLGRSHVRFYSLYMHLQNELATAAHATKTTPPSKPTKKGAPVVATKEATAPAWLSKEGWTSQAKSGAIVLLDEPVEAGALIGRVGRAGPAELSRAQIHLEFFSTSALFGDIENSPWTVVDGTAGGRFCDVEEINRSIDTNHDGKLSRSELNNFYSGAGDETLKFLVTLNLSEWTADPSWSESLRVPTDFRDMPAAELDAMVADQITPGLWWTSELAKHAHLPSDGVVYHYHPVTFLRWFNEKLLETTADSSSASPDASKAGVAPAGVTDDFGDVSGASAVSHADLSDDDCDKSLGLPQLVQGYEAPECAP